MQGLKECLALAERPSVEVIGNAPAKIIEVQQKIDWAEKKRGELLGFEEIAKEKFDGMIEELKRKKTRLQNFTKHDGMSRLSLDPLKWRDPKGFPRIVLFGLYHEPRFEITVDGDWRWHTSGLFERRVWEVFTFNHNLGHLPEKLKACYEDVFVGLQGISAQKKAAVTLSCNYSGLLPDSTREKAKKYANKFNSMFIMAEAEDWKVTLKTKPKPPLELGDPLLVGWDGEDLWLVDHFEMTTIERLVASQFTV